MPNQELSPMNIQNKTSILLAACIVFCCANSVHADPAEKLLVVTVPVADISKKPLDPKPGYSHDDLRETQVLCNEVLRYTSATGAWYCVNAMEQRKFSEGA